MVFLSNLQLNMNKKTRNSWKNSITENIHTHLYVNFEEAPFAEAKYLSIWFNLDIFVYKIVTNMHAVFYKKPGPKKSNKLRKIISIFALNLKKLVDNNVFEGRIEIIF